MATFKQSGRTLTITTPLGDGVLLLVGFHGREEMSKPFLYHLDLVSENLAIAPNDIVGKPVTWTVYPDGATPRLFNGIVSRFGAGPTGSRGYRSYVADVVPWPWFLGLSEDCRIFQDKTALDIITSWFSELGFSDFDDSGVSPAPGSRVYCVQYRETTLDFVSRLMEQEGIYYFFKHADGKHTLTMSTQVSSYWDLEDDPGDAITSWQHHYEFRAGKWTFTDYNFETPATSLVSTTNTILTVPGMDKFERFEYPGHYLVKGDGDAWAKIRMEEEEASYDVVQGASEFMFFSPGGKFAYDPGDGGDETKYVITSVEHSAKDESIGGGSGKGEYSNTFTCIPATVLYRPARTTPWPRVYGPQTAIVTGPSGEEQLVDKYGRVKVQFFWDRKGTKDEKSSCWIRVAQTIAGKGWGAQYIPRMGQEVLVDFLEGDPDRPLVTGAVYNAQNMPPYALPDNMTKSGYLARSTKEGDAVSNELWIEDKKDSEDIYFYAKKDFHRKVEHDDDLKVLNCQTISIKKDRTESVEEGNETITVKKGYRGVTISEGNESLEVTKGKMSTKVGQGDYSLEVSQGKHDTKVSMGDCKLDVAMGNLAQKVDLGKVEMEAMQSIELKVGGSSIKIDQMGVTIKGMMISVEGQVQAEFKGLMAKVSGDAMLQMKGAITMIG
jgi:type VI secretion system secreted protein VgrG